MFTHFLSNFVWMETENGRFFLRLLCYIHFWQLVVFVFLWMIDDLLYLLYQDKYTDDNDEHCSCPKLICTAITKFSQINFSAQEAQYCVPQLIFTIFNNFIKIYNFFVEKFNVIKWVIHFTPPYTLHIIQYYIKY